MFWAYDPYTVLAADLVPGTFVGRYWNSQTRAWERCTDQNPTPNSQQPNRLRIRAIDMRVVSATGGIKSGVRIMCFQVPDAMHPGILMTLVDRYQSAGRLVYWTGDFPMGGGVLWRIQQGGVIATDVVHMSVGYE
jgi:hypothetical protein